MVDENGYTTDVILESNTAKKWSVRCVAKIDTGAKRTSIDSKLCNFLRLEQCGTTKVTNAVGSQRRKLVWLTIYWNEKVYCIKVSVVNREHLSTPMILGQDVLTEQGA
jgi:hypothetical protein